MVRLLHGPRQVHPQLAPAQMPVSEICAKLNMPRSIIQILRQGRTYKCPSSWRGPQCLGIHQADVREVPEPFPPTPDGGQQWWPYWSLICKKQLLKKFIFFLKLPVSFVKAILRKKWISLAVFMTSIIDRESFRLFILWLRQKPINLMGQRLVTAILSKIVSKQTLISSVRAQNDQQKFTLTL